MGNHRNLYGTRGVINEPDMYGKLMESSHVHDNLMFSYRKLPFIYGKATVFFTLIHHTFMGFYDTLWLT